MTTRLHRRVLGPLWPPEPAGENHGFSAVAVTSPVLQALQLQMSAPGVWRSGPLFGRTNEDTLALHVVASSGYRFWNASGGDLHYQLGWADAVTALHPLHLDWVGQWLLRPDNHLPSYTECEWWLRRSAAQGALDENNILLTCGLQDQRLTLNAYRLMDGQVEVLPTAQI